jgi:hypothetical protein
MDMLDQLYCRSNKENGLLACGRMFAVYYIKTCKPHSDALFKTIDGADGLLFGNGAASDAMFLNIGDDVFTWKRQMILKHSG